MIWDKDEALAHHSVSERLVELLPNYLPKDRGVIDYGCGRGFYVDALRKQEYVAFGIEGTPEINEIGLVDDILVMDLTKPIVNGFHHSSSLCLEVAEHIEPKYQKVFLENITKNCAGRLVLSWAIPHQSGHGHVNEKDNLSVVYEMSKLGFYLNLPLTLLIRTEMAGDSCWWFENTLFIFDKV